MALNQVTLMGRITHDLELKTSQSGANYINFSIAIDRNYNKNREERQTDFIPISAFGKQAEFVAKYFKKGSAIIVCGRLQSDSYTDKDGNKRTSYTVVANEISFCEGKKEENQNNSTNMEELPNDDLPFTM